MDNFPEETQDYREYSEPSESTLEDVEEVSQLEEAEPYIEEEPDPTIPMFDEEEHERMLAEAWNHVRANNPDKLKRIESMIRVVRL